jgi:dTDP-4-dehydrorhamnose 3,5-epimerase
MRFSTTNLTETVIVDVDPHRDARGLFARTFCEEEFAAAGLPIRFVQSSLSFNTHRGTLRGMHFQVAPKTEGKLIRCTLGAIHDVAIDLRQDSPTFRRYVAVELSAENRRALYVPPGCAHGFQTLADYSEVLYLMTEFYAPEAARGVRWNDPAFGIEWPIGNPTMSERDATYPDFPR